MVLELPGAFLWKNPNFDWTKLRQMKKPQPGPHPLSLSSLRMEKSPDLKTEIENKQNVRPNWHESSIPGKVQINPVFRDWIVFAFQKHKTFTPTDDYLLFELKNKNITLAKPFQVKSILKTKWWDALKLWRQHEELCQKVNYVSLRNCAEGVYVCGEREREK